MIFADWIYLYVGLISIILLMLLVMRARLLRKKALRKFISPNLIAQLSYNQSKLASQVKFWLLIVGICFAFIALARPQWGFTWQETKSKGTDIIFAIDCSKSMLANDIKPSRIERAKLAIEDSLNYVEGDRIGIVAFSGIAFLQCPLTLDYSAFKMSLSDIDTGLIDRGGTNISAALLEAESAFNASSGAKNIILLSDGEELEEEALNKAKSLAKEGVKIYTIGVGDTRLAPLSYTDNRGNVQYLRDSNGSIVESKLDEERLVEIANATGAFYSRLDENAMQRAILEIQKEKQDLSSKMKQTAIERYQIFLAIALVLLCLESLVGTRKLFVKKLKNISLNKLGSIAIFVFCALTTDLKAEELSPRDIFNAGVLAEEEDAEKAKQLYIKAIQNEYEDMLLHAKALYNIGNIDYRKAKENFEKYEDINEEILQASESALSGYETSKRQGQSLLSEGNYRLINDTANGTNNLEEQGFQNALTQNIQALESISKSFEDFEKAKTPKLSELKLVNVQLESVLNNYSSAQELAPDISQIKNNLKSAKIAKNLIEEKISKLENFAKQEIEESKELLPPLIEDLKKLLRNQENEQDQQQNQENQENQEQNQDNQTQDSQNQDSQQSQNSQQSQDNSQNEQSQDNQQGEENSQDEQNQNQEDSQQENQQNGSDEQPVDNTPEQGEQEGDEQNQEQDSPQNGDEQSNTEQGQEGESQEQGDEQAMGADEQAVSQGDEQGASQGEEAEAGNEEDSAQDFRIREGAMSKREALQLLESTQGNEKHLPFRGFGTSKDRYNQNYKDW